MKNNIPVSTTLLIINSLPPPFNVGQKFMESRYNIVFEEKGANRLT